MNPDLLEQYLAYLAIDKGLSPRSQEAYRKDVSDYLAFVREKGREPIGAGVENVLVLFMSRLHEQGLSPRSISRKASAIRGFYRFLNRENLAKDDPSTVIETPRLGRPLPKVMTLEEVEQILRQPDVATDSGMRDRAMLETLYAAGLRESELIGLELGHYNREGEFLQVMGKGGRERIVPIGRYAIDAIETYLAKARSKLLSDISERRLFLNNRGKPFSRMGIWKMVRKYCLMAGIARPVSPHVFRHSCATHMLEGGASILAVQEMLGHVDVSTTQIYTHLTGQDLKRIHAAAHPRGKAMNP